MTGHLRLAHISSSFSIVQRREDDVAANSLPILHCRVDPRPRCRDDPAAAQRHRQQREALGRAGPNACAIRAVVGARLGLKVGPRLRECCRQAQAEVVSTAF